MMLVKRDKERELIITALATLLNASYLDEVTSGDRDNMREVAANAKAALDLICKRKDVA